MNSSGNFQAITGKGKTMKKGKGGKHSGHAKGSGGTMSAPKTPAGSTPKGPHHGSHKNAPMKA